MTDTLKSRIQAVLGKVDEKVLESKINTALEMIRTKSPEELKNMIKGIDQNEMMAKLNEMEQSGKLEEMGLDKEELKAKLQQVDMEKVYQVLGPSGNELMKKLNEILNK